MIKATLKERKLVCDILTESFQDSNTMRFLINTKPHKLRVLIYCSVLKGLFRGDVFLNEAKNATCMVLFPNRVQFSIPCFLVNIYMLLFVYGISRISQIRNREKLIKETQLKTDFAYLWFLGVFQKDQKKGIGSDFLKEIITHYKDLKIPLCLETSRVRNVPFYKKFGFKIYGTIEHKLPFTLYFFEKDWK